MALALEQARRALEVGEAPIGCVLVNADGEVIGAGHNAMHWSGVVTAHAEIKAFEAAAHRVRPGEAYTMVSTLEPCVMCLGAAMQAGVTTVVYALRAPADAGTTRVDPPSSPNTTAPTTVGNIGAVQSRALFEAWLARHAGDATRAEQQAFIEQLLASTTDHAR
jgi:tRNA(Arg) A34 adenosine deaminase TadA